ncbi:signal recognition particle subunit SRP72-like [Uloborus diversus]|uniref:signal recognition particle subunit SRP72-like n=1 Tax=Uloborus diversus TaxID=327109 RepID=UPI0024092D6F|nr:signal recognition particle subunit SRP72-like [Uloborus diversus]
MMTAPNTHITAYYTELVRAGDNGEFDKALKIANKILHEDKDDKKAQHCKAVCLIHLSEFEDALKILEKHVSNCNFEKAYCFYRLNRIPDAYNALKSINNPGIKEKELLAQVLYRLENYDECFSYYKDLIKNSEDDFEEERETNLSAVVSNLYAEKGNDFKAPQLREHTYELCYNTACILINRKEYNLAIEKLKLAEELCKKTLEENDATEEEIEAELGVIRVQHGYVLQLLNKNDRALKIYNQVLKNKPSDLAVAAVACNNVVTINKDQNVFDSKKKIKIATADNLESKLTSKQQQMIAINNCLLLLHTNQIDQCRRAIQSFRKKFSSCAAEAALLSAGLFCKEKKVQKAVDVLKEFAASNPDQSVLISFTLAQLLLMQGHVSQACDILRSIGENVSYTPGVISALVTLYLSMEDKESAISVLQNAIKWYRKNLPKDPALNTLIQETAKLELKYGNPQEAAKLLEELRKDDPEDLKTLAQLISAYSQFDPDKAKLVSKQLPPVSEVSLKVDVDTLESASWTMGAKYIKKSGKTETPSTKPESGDILLHKKKRKHKKGKLPKHYDPSVDPDPERWLPRRERSTFKKKKDKRGATIGKGTQGAVASSEDTSKSSLSANVPSPGASTTPTSPNVQGPRQTKGAQKKKKKTRW